MFSYPALTTNGYSSTITKPSTTQAPPTEQTTTTASTTTVSTTTSSFTVWNCAKKCAAHKDCVGFHYNSKTSECKVMTSYKEFNSVSSADWESYRNLPLHNV